jgi:hypothetical protein
VKENRWREKDPSPETDDEAGAKIRRDLTKAISGSSCRGGRGTGRP